MQQPQGAGGGGGRRDITVRDHDMVRGAMRCHAVPCDEHEGFCHPLLLARYCRRGPPGAVDDGGSGSGRLAPGSWHLGRQGGQVDDRMPMQARLHLEGGHLITLMRARAGWQAGMSAARAQQDAHTMAGHCEEQMSTALDQARQLCRPGKAVAAAGSVDIHGGRKLPRAGRCRTTSPGISSCRLAQQGARLPSWGRSCRTVADFPQKVLHGTCSSHREGAVGVEL